MRIFEKIKNDSFLRNSLIYFIGSMLVAFFNYLFYPILGRIMSVNDFGEVQTLVALQAQIGIFLGAFGIVVTNITVNLDPEERANVISQLRRVLLAMVVLVSAAIVLFSRQLEIFFRFDNGYVFAAFAAIFPVTALFMVRNAYLQGMKDFVAISISGLIVSVGRVLLAATLVFIGWKSAGAMLGILIAQLIALAYVFNLTKVSLPPRFSWFPSGAGQASIRPELFYGLLTIAATGCITFLSTADIILVKHYFPSDIAGLYSGISVVSKIIFFVSGPVVGVMFSSIRMNNGNKANLKILIKSFYLILAIGLATLLTFELFYDIIVNLLMGQKYLPMAPILVRLSIVAFIVSLVSLLVNYCLALRRNYLFVIAVIGLLTTLISNHLQHNSVEAVVNSFLIGTTVTFLLLASAIAMEYKNSKN